MTAVTPFHIAVPEADLADLRERLTRTRWPEPETVPDWSQGVPLDYLIDLCRSWAESYDWRVCENRLNRLDQFRTTIFGLPIHFVHVRSPHPAALPLVLTHGWPGSVLEFEAVVGPLTDPTAYGARQRTLSTWSCRPCPGTRSAASPPPRVGASPGSPTRGRS